MVHNIIVIWRGRGVQLLIAVVSSSTLLIVSTTNETHAADNIQ